MSEGAAQSKQFVDVSPEKSVRLLAQQARSFFLDKVS